MCCRPGTPARCSAWTTPAQQEDLAPRIVAEGLSVRATEEAVLAGAARRAAPRRAAPPQAGARIPALHELAERLSDTFDTRVRVELGQRKGRIVGRVRRRSDDLERIADLMGGALG